MKIKLSTIVRLCALILVILFFVPTTIVSCNSYMASYEVEISPFGLATGTLKADSEDAEEYMEEVEAQPILFVMLGLSVIVLIFGSKIPILGAIVTLANTVMLYLMHNGIVDYVIEEYDGMGVHVSKTGAFTGYVALSGIVMILLIMKQFRIFDKLQKRKKSYINIGERYCGTNDIYREYLTQQNKSEESNHTDDGKKKCPMCGAEIQKDLKFCGSCGSKL